MNCRTFLSFLAALGLLVERANAHIGSPAVIYDGSAGPYSVRVIILPPLVIPGRAEVNVRLLKPTADPVTVSVLPVLSDAGLKGAPPPDVATAVPGEPNLRHGELWLMSPGSYSVQVTLTGSLGHGTAIVPVTAVATRRDAMGPALGILLGALGAVLIVGAATLVGAAVRDSVRPPGAPLTTRQRVTGGLAAVAAAVALGFSVYGGKNWWDAVDREYRSNQIYRADPLSASVTADAGHRVLHLEVVPDGTFSEDTLLLIPDHGKLMHLFLIREPGLDALAHIHPVRTGPHAFAVDLPPLPDGRYRLYADITYETGFAATLTTETALGASAQPGIVGAIPQRDPDDSWWVSAMATQAPQGPHLILDGPGEIHCDEDVNLSFLLKDAGGNPLPPQPYMGMMGHAAVRRSDGSVFAHLHPVGTISMAAQDFFIQQNASETGAAAHMDHSMHHHHGATGSRIAFPYLFPKPGAYRVWVQTRADGHVVTGAFDLTVLPART